MNELPIKHKTATQKRTGSLNYDSEQNVRQKLEKSDEMG